MKVSKRKLVKATAGLDWVRAQKKNTEVSFKTSRQLRTYEPALRTLDVDRNEIQREYTLLDEETGQPVTTVTAGGNVGTRLTDQFAYEDAMEALMEEEVDVPVTPMKKDAFVKTFKQCEGGHLMTLVDIGFVEDPDAPKETPTKEVDDEDEDDSDE